MKPSHLTQEKHIVLSGPAGKLEALATELAPEQNPVVAVICHPHPLFGGTMHNKVVFTISRALQSCGIPTVRFNFRGVGESEGIHDDANGEVDDLATVVDWVKQQHPTSQLILAGFSFGSFVAAKYAQTIKPAMLISIAPPVHHYDFEHITFTHAPWLVVQGDKDEVVPPEAVFDWLGQNPHIEQVVMAEAGHFFHGRLTELKTHLIEKLRLHNMEQNI